MNQKQLNIRLKSMAWAVLLIVYLFQESLVTWVPQIKYMDELFAIAFLLYYLLGLIRHKISKIDGLIAIVMALLLVIGFMGNVFSQIEKKVFSQFHDAFNTFKYVFVVWGGSRYFEKYATKKYLINYLSLAIKVTLLISTMFMVMNWITDIGMHTDEKYGIRSYHFIFIRVGSLYSACIVWLMILTAQKYCSPTKADDIFIALTLVHMCSTLRSRAIAFAALYLVVYYLVIYNTKKRQWWLYAVMLTAVLLVVGKDQFEFYFSEDSQSARNILLQYGFVTATTYFPFGAGFGTYGTAVARDNYSMLYRKYKFGKYWGLSRRRPWFLTDNFWPAVMGQFGYFGVGLMAALIALVSVKLVKMTDNRYSKACIIFLLGTLLISSTVSSAFMSMACSQAMVFACLISKLDYSDKDTTIRNIEHETSNRLYAHL